MKSNFSLVPDSIFELEEVDRKGIDEFIAKDDAVVARDFLMRTVGGENVYVREEI